jgi:hypothetical protein
MKAALLKFVRVSVLILFAPIAVFGSEATVYYSQFNIDPYVPYSASQIKTSAAEKWVLTDDAQITHLLKILTTGPKAHFDGSCAKVVVCFGDETYIVDCSGVVQHGTSSIKIDWLDIYRFRGTLPDREIHSND